MPFGVSSTLAASGVLAMRRVGTTLDRAASMSTPPDIDRERRLFELVRDPLFVSKADGRIIGANQAGRDLLGLTEAELVSRPYPELLHPEDREATDHELAEVLAHGQTPTPFRVRIVRSDGEIRWVETQSTLDRVTGLIY